MNKEGPAGGGKSGGGGRGERVDTDEIIHQLESEEVRKRIEKQFSKKKKALGELRGKFKQQSEEKLELSSFSSTKQVLLESKGAQVLE